MPLLPAPPLLVSSPFRPSSSPCPSLLLSSLVVGPPPFLCWFLGVFIFEPWDPAFPLGSRPILRHGCCPCRGPFWCPLGNPWSAFLRSTTTSTFGTRPQHWPWQHRRPSSFDALRSGWNPKRSGPTYGPSWNRTCGTQDRSPIPKENGAVLEMFLRYPTSFKDLQFGRLRTRLEPGLLPMGPHAELTRMVGKEDLAFPWRMAFGGNQRRVQPVDPWCASLRGPTQPDGRNLELWKQYGTTKAEYGSQFGSASPAALLTPSKRWQLHPWSISLPSWQWRHAIFTCSFRAPRWSWTTSSQPWWSYHASGTVRFVRIWTLPPTPTTYGTDGQKEKDLAQWWHIYFLTFFDFEYLLFALSPRGFLLLPLCFWSFTLLPAPEGRVLYESWRRVQDFCLES